MARTRPFPKSFLGCGTTSVSPETALLKTWWEPVTRTRVHPSRSKRRIISRLFVNIENLFDTRQTKDDPLTRPARRPDGRWTVDAWGPLDGRVLNGGVRVGF